MFGLIYITRLDVICIKHRRGLWSFANWWDPTASRFSEEIRASQYPSRNLGEGMANWLCPYSSKAAVWTCPSFPPLTYSRRLGRWSRRCSYHRGTLPRSFDTGFRHKPRCGPTPGWGPCRDCEKYDGLWPQLCSFLHPKELTLRWPQKSRLPFWSWNSLRKCGLNGRVCGLLRPTALRTGQWWIKTVSIVKGPRLQRIGHDFSEHSGTFMGTHAAL